MPFTFAHPTFAFPLKYINPRFFSVTGLVLGSMAPDFEYFLHLEPYESIGHSVLGFFIYAIPISIILALIFHYIVKESFAIHLPSLFKVNQRAYNILGEWKLNHFRAWFVFLISVAIGFFSHVFVDSFTHLGGFFVIRIPFLKEATVFNLPIYKILQYSLSLIGLFVIFTAIIYKLYKSNAVTTAMPQIARKRKLVFWTFILVFVVLTTMMKLMFTSSNNTLGILVVAPISGFCLGLVLMSVVMKILRRASVAI